MRTLASLARCSRMRTERGAADLTQTRMTTLGRSLDSATADDRIDLALSALASNSRREILKLLAAETVVESVDLYALGRDAQQVVLDALIASNEDLPAVMVDCVVICVGGFHLDAVIDAVVRAGAPA